MRLTLRTMLAYLDDVLEPADAKELGRKIEESEFATGLVHRLRSSMRRLRLGAPKLSDDSAGLDCNSVAEYLDNTLPPEKVPGFEKACLESEVNLAEVAACHQVLTLVLGEPAEVESTTRERVYRIGTEVENQRAAGAGIDQPTESPVPPPKSDMSTVATAVTAAAGETAGGGTEGDAEEHAAQQEEHKAEVRKKPEVPDYLKSDSRLRFWPVVITLGLALLLIGAVVMALGPDTVKQWLGGGERPPAVAANGTSGELPPQGAAPLPETPGGEAIAPGPSALPLAHAPGQVPSEPAGVGPVARDPASGTGQDATPSDPAALGATDLGERTGPLAVAPIPAAPGGEAVVPEGDPTAPSGDGLVDPPGPKPGEDELAKFDPFESPPSDPTMVEREPAAPDAGEEPAAADGAVDLGRFTSDQEILVRHDADTGDWSRVPTRDAVRSGDRLLALPTFRPQVLLVNGIQMTLDGATAVQLSPPDESGVVWVNVEYGRLLLITVGRAGAQLGLQIGELRGVVTFQDADTTTAMSVQKFQLAGKDPESRDAHVRADLFATSGIIEWQLPGSEAVEVVAGRVRTFIDTVWAETTDATEMPSWIGGNDVSEIDQRASLDIRPELNKGEVPVSQRLLELAEHRRPEVRSLAVRCGAYIGEFDPFVAALNDPSQKSYWSGEVDVLGESVHRGPATAALVRQTLEKHRTADAENLYRLLWGFSEKDLEGGWDARLVEYLANDSLDIRVLAIENLRRITGRTLTYRAEYTPDRRRSQVSRWRERLDSGGVRYEIPPATLPEPGEPPVPTAEPAAPATVPATPPAAPATP